MLDTVVPDNMAMAHWWKRKTSKHRAHNGTMDRRVQCISHSHCEQRNANWIYNSIALNRLAWDYDSFLCHPNRNPFPFALNLREEKTNCLRWHQVHLSMKPKLMRLQRAPLYLHFAHCFCHGASGFCFDWCKAMREFCVNRIRAAFLFCFGKKCWMKMQFEWEKQEMRFDIHPSLCLADNGIYLYLYLALRCHPLSAHLSHGSQFAFNLYFFSMRYGRRTTSTSDEIHSMSTLRCVHLSGARNSTQSHFHF